MEDDHCVLDSFPDEFKDELNAYPSPHGFYGIYDGHRGQRAAIYAAKHVHGVIVKRECFGTDPEEAIRTGFMEADVALLKTAEEEGGWNDGCTAAVALVLGPRVVVGNVGDAEVIMGRENEESAEVEPLVLTKIHKPSDPEEKARIMAQGGMVLGGRVGGALAVARALGDLQFKRPSCEGEIEVGKLISEEPFTRSVDLEPLRDKFIVVACDGIYESLSHADVVAYVSGNFEKSPQDLSEGLCKHAHAKGSADNISACVVKFQWG
eukprot:TRINITY_DN8216_c0_g1_i1.p2 TRINITY_DN8216_c0_g1~~TRINITY_DN8216_c0_g1_i1.p2  ORF type:complete len:265 (-),score=91.11 TRINITY_DN8216_c0_g1_i1:601-1395(-)